VIFITDGNMHSIWKDKIDVDGADILTFLKDMDQYYWQLNTSDTIYDLCFHTFTSDAHYWKFSATGTRKHQAWWPLGISPAPPQGVQHSGRRMLWAGVALWGPWYWW
jgi:hypothetical protein